MSFHLVTANQLTVSYKTIIRINCDTYHPTVYSSTKKSLKHKISITKIYHPDRGIHCYRFHQFQCHWIPSPNNVTRFAEHGKPQNWGSIFSTYRLPFLPVFIQKFHPVWVYEIK